MRYEKADNLLQLALEMQARRGGMSLMEIEEAFGVGRRTAMRMRDAILRNFPQAEEMQMDDRTKRWRIPSGILNQLVSFSADELATLEAAVRVLEDHNREGEATELAGIAAKLKALMKPESLSRAEPDLEALLEAEGLAMRPGPRPFLRGTVVQDLRTAIKGGNQVALQYRNRRNGKLNRRIVHPYGFLHGHRHYLVGFHDHPKAQNIVLFSLANIEGVEILPDMFERPDDFDLQGFAEQSFGLFQEEAFDVVWRFSKQAAATAADFRFHPTEQKEKQKDGSLIVRFKAGSDIEMAWHLMMWGTAVEVLEPKHLADMVNPNRVDWGVLP